VTGISEGRTEWCWRRDQPASRKQDDTANEIGAVRCETASDTVPESMPQHVRRRAGECLDHRGNIGGKVMERGAGQRSGAACDTAPIDGNDLKSREGDAPRGVVDYSTVPITSSLVASHLGIERMGLAAGLISAGHAVGGSLGAFLGGYLFDRTASYGLVWWSGVWLAIVAAVLVLPLGERGGEPKTV